VRNNRYIAQEKRIANTTSELDEPAVTSDPGKRT